MRIGAVADDLTGATDLAGFLANGGLDTTLILGLPEQVFPEWALPAADAAVVSLRTRSCLPGEAVAASLSALESLKAAGCGEIYFKYCSTFDSTPAGNIGPVTDALLDRLDSDFTVICPALPVNGRTVRGGVLFVDGVPLAESGMRHHPINPMTESDLTRLIEAQGRGRAGVVRLETIRQGSAAIAAALAELRTRGRRYAVLDTETNADLAAAAAALDGMKLLTGGSGLGGARAQRITRQLGRPALPAARASVPAGKAVILSGSCSEMTGRQVALYRSKAASRKVDPARCLADPAAYAAELADWAEMNAGPLAPAIYATAAREEVAAAQARFGADATARAVEAVFSLLAERLADVGFTRFIVAGGETAGAVTAALRAGAFRLGPEIAPGVPWITGTASPLCLALKSGNFGREDFFVRAQELMER